MAIQHLRSSTANKRPNPVAMSDGQVAVNTASASPGLFFKDANGNLIKVGPVHVGATAPNANPASGGTAGNSIGEQWLDISGTNPVMRIWSGSAWASEAGEFVNASGDTMTGALIMANQQQIRFTEASGNGTNFIAVQAPAAVASDRTLTLPDVTGTFVTTGDTGSVTSAMIANGTITNDDISASAAIVDTKLATISTASKVSNSATTATNANTPSAIVARDGSGNFTAGTITASLTGTASGNLPLTGGTLTGALVGTQAEFSVNASGTLNGEALVQRLRSNAVSNAVFLDVKSRRHTAGTTWEGVGMRLQHQVDVTAMAFIEFNSLNAGQDIAIGTGGNTRLLVDSAGRVGIGTSTVQAGHTLQVNGIIASVTSFGAFTALQAAGGTGFRWALANDGTFRLQRTTDGFTGVSSTPIMIDASSRVGIGTTAPTEGLQVANGNVLIGTGSSLAGYRTLYFGGTTATGRFAYIEKNNDSPFDFNIVAQTSPTPTSAINFKTTPTSTAATIDSSGRLLVGTGSSISEQYSGQARIQTAGTGYYGLSSFQYSNDTVENVVSICKSRGATVGTHAVVQANDTLASLRLHGSDGTGFLTAAVISVQVDGTAVTNAGSFVVGRRYKILTVGDTNFTLIGASANTVGVIFAATGVGTGTGTATSEPYTNSMPGRLMFATTADGASSPTERLRIDSTGQIEANGLGSAAAPTYSWLSDPDSGLYSPGANQLAISTGGLRRLFIQNNEFRFGAPDSNPVVFNIGNEATGDRSVYADLITDTTYTDFGLRLGREGGANSTSFLWHRGTGDFLFLAGEAAPIKFSTSNVERLRIESTGGFRVKGAGTAGSTDAFFINGSAPANSFQLDSSGRVLVGTTTARNTYLAAGISAGINVEAAGNLGANNRSISLVNGYSVNTDGDPCIYLGRTRSDTVGGTTIVQNNDGLGRIAFVGSDGTNMPAGAWIRGEVDGTPGVGDMPGRLVFSTTADGAASPTERLRIDSAGQIEAGSLGTAAAPVLTFLADPNTGIYSPGADQLAVATNGVQRLTVDTAATTSTLPVLHPLGAVATPSITFTGDLNTGFWSPTADTLAISTAGEERLRITAAGRMGIGASSPGDLLEINSTTADTGLYIRSRGANNRKAHLFFLTLNSIGGNTGGTIFHDGSGLAFNTGTNTTAEVFRFDVSGVRCYNQAAPATGNATGTLTIANLRTGIITSTSAAATDLTLPTGTDTQAGFGTTYDNFTFEWSVINTGPSLVRVLDNGTSHVVVGSRSVATGTSARFASRRTAANTFTAYRLT